MSIILPTAPANFYAPSLNTLKNAMQTINGTIAGQLTILTAVPNNADTAWGEVGAGNPDIDSSRGTLVAGQAPIGIIVGPSTSLAETSEEVGYKLEFQTVPDIEINIAPLSSVLIVGFALIIGRDTFAEGINDDVRYLARIDDALVTDIGSGEIISVNSNAGSISVNDGDLIELPQWDLIINYAEPIT